MIRPTRANTMMESISSEETCRCIAFLELMQLIWGFGRQVHPPQPSHVHNTHRISRRYRTGRLCIPPINKPMARVHHELAKTRCGASYAAVLTLRPYLRQSRVLSSPTQICQVNLLLIHYIKESGFYYPGDRPLSYHKFAFNLVTHLLRATRPSNPTHVNAAVSSTSSLDWP